MIHMLQFHQTSVNLLWFLLTRIYIIISVPLAIFIFGSIPFALLGEGTEFLGFLFLPFIYFVLLFKTIQRTRQRFDVVCENYFNFEPEANG